MIRSCPKCGQQNRMPLSRLAEVAHCGSCKANLPPVDEPIEVDREQFREIVNSTRVPVLVDFWAEWCPPCRMAAPHVARVAKNLAGEALVLKVDTEENPELAAVFKVQGIPNFAVLVGGNLVHQQAGLVPHHEMERWLRNAASDQDQRA